MDEITMEVYNMLSMKNKIKLNDDWGIDCPHDLQTRIKEEADEWEE